MYVVLLCVWWCLVLTLIEVIKLRYISQATYIYDYSFSLIWFYCFASLRFVNTIAVGDVPSLRNPLGATPWLNSRMLASVRPFIFLVFLFPFFLFQLGFCIVRWIHWRGLRKSPFAKTHGDSVPYFLCLAFSTLLSVLCCSRKILLKRCLGKVRGVG